MWEVLGPGLQDVPLHGPWQAVHSGAVFTPERLVWRTAHSCCLAWRSTVSQVLAELVLKKRLPWTKPVSASVDLAGACQTNLPAARDGLPWSGGARSPFPAVTWWRPPWHRFDVHFKPAGTFQCLEDRVMLTWELNSGSWKSSVLRCERTGLRGEQPWQRHAGNFSLGQYLRTCFRSWAKSRLQWKGFYAWRITTHTQVLHRCITVHLQAAQCWYQTDLT